MDIFNNALILFFISNHFFGLGPGRPVDGSQSAFNNYDPHNQSQVAADPRQSQDPRYVDPRGLDIHGMPIAQSQSAPPVRQHQQRQSSQPPAHMNHQQQHDSRSMIEARGMENTGGIYRDRPQDPRVIGVNARNPTIDPRQQYRYDPADPRQQQQQQGMMLPRSNVAPNGPDYGPPNHSNRMMQPVGRSPHDPDGRSYDLGIDSVLNQRGVIMRNNAPMSHMQPSPIQPPSSSYRPSTVNPVIGPPSKQSNVPAGGNNFPALHTITQGSLLSGSAMLGGAAIKPIGPPSFTEIIPIPEELAVVATEAKFIEILQRVKEQSMVTSLRLNRIAEDFAESVSIEASTKDRALLGRSLVDTHIKQQLRVKAAESRLHKVQTDLSSTQGEIASGHMVEFIIKPELIGLSIGKKGARIRQIEAETGVGLINVGENGMVDVH